MSLKECRELVADALSTSDVQAFAFVPESIVPPAAVVVQGNPYIEKDGATFNEWRVNLDVLLIAPKATNEVTINALDVMVADSVEALIPLKAVQVQEVGQPLEITVAGKAFVGAYISLTVFETSL